MSAESGILNRDGIEDLRVPMDEAKYQRIKSAFERNGCKIESSDEYDKYLDWRGADAATLDAKTIVFRSGSPPTASELFEELIHAAQHRRGIVSTDNVLQLEMAAKEKLISYQRNYDIPDMENEQTIMHLEGLRQFLFTKGR